MGARNIRSCAQDLDLLVEDLRARGVTQADVATRARATALRREGEESELPADSQAQSLR